MAIYMWREWPYRYTPTANTAWYRPLDTEAENSDLSWNNRTLTEVSVSWYGKWGANLSSWWYLYYWDGSYVLMNNQQTYAWWFKLRDITNYATLITYRNWSWSNWGVNIVYVPTWIIRVYSPYSSWYYVDANISVQNNEWFFFALTHNLGNSSLYVNWSLASSWWFSLWWSGSNYGLRLWYDNSWWWDSLTSVWNVILEKAILTASEIQDIYDNSKWDYWIS